MCAEDSPFTFVEEMLPYFVEFECSLQALYFADFVAEPILYYEEITYAPKRSTNFMNA
jgi:hypothetical protein